MRSLRPALIAILITPLCFSAAAVELFAAPDKELNVELTLAPHEAFNGKILSGWLAALPKLAPAGNSRELRTALEAVAAYGPSASAALPDLMFLSTRKNETEVSLLAIRALGALGAHAAPAEPGLLAALGNVMEPPVYRAAVCRALIQINPGGSATRKSILLASADRSPEVRHEAILALLILASPARPVVKNVPTPSAATWLFDPQAVAANAAHLPAMPAEPPGVFPFPPALDALNKALRDPASARDAAQVFAALGETGLDALLKLFAKEDAPGLQTSLKKTPPQVREAAADALGGMPQYTARIIPALIQAARKSTLRGEREALAYAVARLNPREPAALELLAESLGASPGPGQPKREKSAEALLSEAGVAAWPALRLGLNSTTTAARATALKVFSEQYKGAAIGLPPAANVWVPEVVARLRDSEEMVRSRALELLNRAGPDAAIFAGAVEAIRSFERACPSGSREQRFAALTALNVARPAGSPARLTPLDDRPPAELIKILHEPRASSLERSDAAEALRLHPNDDLAAAELIRASNDTDAPLRRAAAKALGAYGSRAAPGIPILLIMLEAEPRSRAAAMTAFARLGASAPSELLAPTLARCAALLEWPDEPDFASSLQSAMQPHASQVVPALVGFAMAGVPASRARAARALGLLKTSASPALSALVELSKSSNEEEAGAAFDAMREIGPERQAETVAYLCGVVRDNLLAEWRHRAVRALGAAGRSLDPGAPDELDALVIALNDPDISVQHAAMEELLKRGIPAARKIVEYLEQPSSATCSLTILATLARLKSRTDLISPRALTYARSSQCKDADRAVLAEIFGNYEDVNADIISTLIRFSVSEGETGPRAARRVLTPIAAREKKVIAALDKLQYASDPRIRLRAAETLQILSNSHP